MLSRMRSVVCRDGHSGVTEFHRMVGAVLTAILGHLGRGRGDGSERERHGHAERKLQKQHGAECPSSRARSHDESLHRFRTEEFRVHIALPSQAREPEPQRVADYGHGLKLIFAPRSVFSRDSSPWLWP